MDAFSSKRSAVAAASLATALALGCSVPAFAQQTEALSVGDSIAVGGYTVTVVQTGDSVVLDVEQARQAQASVAATASGGSSTGSAWLEKYGTFEPLHYEGTGDSVVQLDVTGVPLVFTMRFDDSGYKSVKAIDGNGDSVDLLVNTVGAYAGTTTTFDDRDYASVQMLEIHSDGNWSIDVTPISAVQTIASGATGMGDAVVYVPPRGSTVVSFSFDDDSYHSAKGIVQGDRTRLLVNVAKQYTGDVIWKDGEGILLIQTEGNWQVSW